MEVIPGINCHLGDFECVKGKVRDAEKFSKWVHLDIADGIFTFNKTWNNPEEWKKLNTSLNLEVHLMVHDPLKAVEPWFEAGAKRIIVHFETLNAESAREIVKLSRNNGCAVMLSLNPETKIDELKEPFLKFAEYQILSVHPGLPGQKILPLTLKKISELKKQVASARIEVDGGITPEFARLAKQEGASAVVSASYIFNSPHKERAYAEFLEI